MSAGDSNVFLPSGAARGALRFSSTSVQHVEEPVLHDGVAVDFAAFCRAAAGLGLPQNSGWDGWGSRGSTGSADVGDLLVCKR